MIYTGGHLTILESVDSTNNYAMAKVRTGLAKHGDGYFAMAQVQGKGQRGKAWLTDPGTNIILTLVLNTSGLQLAQQFLFNAAIALGIHDFFAANAGDETTIKWPNDIYWRDRKAAGLLIENIIGGKDPRTGAVDLAPNSAPSVAWHWAIAGMGVNINQTSFPENVLNAVSLKQITGKEWNIIDLAGELGNSVQHRYKQFLAGDDLMPAYNDRLFKKGQTVKFKKGGRVFEGLVKEVTAGGELLVFTALDEYFTVGALEWVF